MKITDIRTNLKKDINIKSFYNEQILWTEEALKNKNSLDLFLWTRWKILNIIRNKKIKLKNITKLQIESLSQNKKKKLKDINLDPNKENIEKKKQVLHKRKLNTKNKVFKTNNVKNKSIIERYKWSKYKVVINFAIICIIFLLWYLDKIVIENLTNSWFNKIISLKEDFSSGEKNKKIITSARFDFVLANILLTPFKIIPIQETKNASNLIYSWKETTKLLTELNNLLFETKSLIEKKGIDNIMFSQLLENQKQRFLLIENSINKIFENISKLHFSDKVLTEKAENLKTKLWEYKSFVHTFNSNFETILDILWHSRRKNYLVVFQNNDEIRPLWGFMWSMWIMDIFRWQIKNFDKNDVYFYEWKLKTESYEKELAPEWLNKLTTYLWLRDSNYFIKVSDSSDKIKFFLDNAWYNIDWIIYLNQNFISKLIEINWPFYSKTLSNNVTKDNFSELMSILVEWKVSKEGTMWTPKQVLFDFSEELKNNLISKKENYFKYLNLVINEVKNKELIFYDFNRKERELLNTLWVNWDFIKPETIDFNYPVFTSISWNKSNRYLKTSYEKTVLQNKDCSIDTSLKVVLQNNFTEILEKRISDLMSFYKVQNSQKSMYIQWKWDNIEYVRIILPKDSEIKDTKEILEIKELDIWKQIDFYIKTPVWEKKDFLIEYKLQNKNCSKYSYSLIKQAWIKNYDLIYSKDLKSEFLKDLTTNFIIKK